MNTAPLLYRFRSLELPGLVHGVTLRTGGTSQGAITGFNLGHTVGDDPAAVEHNHALLFAELGLEPGQVVSPYQVHGDHIACVGHAQGGSIIPATDGLVTAEPGVALLLRFADCVPVLLYDPVRRVIGLAHAGWRGALARVARNAVETMASACGCRAEDIRAGIGPSIGPCCYEVGPEVIAATRSAFPDHDELYSRQSGSGHAYLDLWAIVKLQLREAGVTRIEGARLCTACRTDLFYSFRREGTASGRFAAIIALRPTGV